MGRGPFMKNQVAHEEAAMSDDERNAPEGYGACGMTLIIISGIFTVLLFPLTICLAIKIIPEYKRAVIFRLGRIEGNKAVGPGLFFVIPCTDTFISVDLRLLAFDIPPQEILTKDSVTCTVDGVIYFRVVTAIDSVKNVEEVEASTMLLAQTTLRNILGTRSLSEILSDRKGISADLLRILDEATDPWGIKVERVDVKDVRLPKQLQRSMAAEAEASRDARAKIIAAEGEMNASKSLKEAADVIATSDSAIQLRFLQTLTQISGERNSTIVVPIPIEVMKGMGKS